MHTNDKALRLRQFIRFDVALSVAGSAATLAVWALVTPHAPVVVLAVAVLAAGGVMAGGLVPLRRGDLVGAVTWVAVGNWLDALVVSTLAPFTMPVMTMTALLPTVLAVPYVGRRRLVGFIATSTAVLTASAVVAPLDPVGIAASTPAWTQRGIVIGFLPLLAGLVATTAWQNGETLRGTIGAVLTANRRLRASELALADQAAALLASRARLATAALEERRRIERDLHDGAQQRLLAVAVRLQAVRSAGADGSAPLADALDGLVAELRAASVELRDLAHGLYPAVLSDLGLPEALATAVRRSGLRHRLELAPVGRPSPTVEASVYFCCAEALHNAMRHAGREATVLVVLGRDGDDVVFEVADDGPGFDGGAGRGTGLQNMRDRMASVGGTLAVDTAPGHGVHLRGRVPAPVGVPEDGGAVSDPGRWPPRPVATRPAPA